MEDLPGTEQPEREQSKSWLTGRFVRAGILGLLIGGVVIIFSHIGH